MYRNLTKSNNERIHPSHYKNNFIHICRLNIGNGELRINARIVYHANDAIITQLRINEQSLKKTIVKILKKNRLFREVSMTTERESAVRNGTVPLDGQCIAACAIDVVYISSPVSTFPRFLIFSQ